MLLAWDQSLGQVVAEMQAVMRTPPVPATEQTPALGHHESSLCGEAVLASWQLLVGGNMLSAVWSEHRPPGAKGNQSGAPAHP